MGLQLQSLCVIGKLNCDYHVSDLINNTRCIDKQGHGIPCPSLSFLNFFCRKKQTKTSKNQRF